MSVIEPCEETYHKYSDAEKDTDTMKAIAEEYRETVCPALCKYNFGLNRKQALWLCDTLGQGNWKKMWLTDEDNANPTARSADS